METATGMTLQEAARTTGTAKSSILQFRWLDAPRSIGTARSAQAPGFESPVAAGTKDDAMEHGGMGGNEVLQQVLQRAILLEASLKDMTAQRDRWMVHADDWKEAAQQAQRLLLAPPVQKCTADIANAARNGDAPVKKCTARSWWRWLRSPAGK